MAVCPGLLGRTPVTLAGSPHLPTTVLLAGLQGSGKTTFAGKLARWLKARSKRVLLASGVVRSVIWLGMPLLKR